MSFEWALKDETQESDETFYRVVREEFDIDLLVEF